MKLLELIIEDYKSIKKLSWIINQGLTCLVGQNESGKSNIIEVFEFLTPEKIKTLNYEMHTNRSSDRYINNKLPLIKAVYEVDNRAKKYLVDIFEPFVGHKDMLEEITKISRFVIQSEINSSAGSNLYFEDEENYFTLNYLVPSATHHPAILKALEELRTSIIKLDDNYIDKFEVTLQQAKTNALPNSPLIKLMRLGGVKDFTKLNSNHSILSKYLSQLNKKLNKTFTRKYYSQDNSVELNIIHNSGNLFLEISDNTEAEYSIDERSDGFKYFFGLLIEVASMDMKDSDGIFILDEPGNKLHPNGQRDLLKYLEELSTNYRVIYTSHSPFLINRLYPNRVRVVERDKTHGTRFKFKGFSKNWRPMRTALGLSLSDSFYYSEKALLVEGPEDVIYLSSLITLFNRLEEVKIKTDIFSFIDAGSSSNLPSMVQIMIEEERPIMVLIDSDSVSIYNRLEKKRKTLRSGALILHQINEFREDAISIEDLIPKELLKSATNNYMEELLKDGSIILVDKRDELISEISEDNSRYKFIAEWVKGNYSNPSKSPEEWAKEKTPISKVGIARHFEQIISDDKFDYDRLKVEFKDSLKLIKTVINKLKLKV